MPRREPPDLVSLFVPPRNRLGVPYFVTGALAAGMYGEPRLTNDVDLVVELSKRDAVRPLDAFDASAFYVPPLEVMRAEQSRARDGHFNLIHHETAYKADVYLVGDDPLNRWGLERREQVGFLLHELARERARSARGALGERQGPRGIAPTASADGAANDGPPSAPATVLQRRRRPMDTPR